MHRSMFVRSPGELEPLRSCRRRIGISAIGTDGDRTVVPVDAVASSYRGRWCSNRGKINHCFRFAIGYGIDVGVVC